MEHIKLDSGKPSNGKLENILSASSRDQSSPQHPCLSQQSAGLGDVLIYLMLGTQTQSKWLPRGRTLNSLSTIDVYSIYIKVFSQWLAIRGAILNFQSQSTKYSVNLER